MFKLTSDQKLFLKSLATYSIITLAIIAITIKSYGSGRYILAIPLTIILVILALVPFYGAKMNEFVTDATLWHMNRKTNKKKTTHKQ